MRNFFTKLSVLGVLSLSLVSCEDMLDIPQRGVLSLDTYYQTDEQATAAVMQCYYYWQYCFTSNYNMYNGLSDDCYGGGGGRGENANVNEYQFTNTFAGTFQKDYRLIYYANLVLENVTGDSAEMQRCRAEAHFFRAWAYLDLVMLYGTPPLVKTTLTDPNNYAQPNGNTAEIWAFIEEEFNAAINAGVLPSKKSKSDVIVRLTKEAAQSYLGKAYLFQRKYGEAAAVLKKVIDANLYELGDISNFDNMGHVAGNDSPEYIFATRGYNDDTVNLNCIYGIPPYFAGGWRYQDAFAVNMGSTYSNLYAAGYGYLQGVRKGLWDEFEEGDLRRPYTAISFEEGQAQLGLRMINETASASGVEGYLRTKHEYKFADNLPMGSMAGWYEWYAFGNKGNLPEMRLANVYLMYAEACIQNGSSDGNKYIDAVRARAGLGTPPLGYTMDEIIHERRVELAMEECRYLDLLRWGLCEKYLGNQGESYPMFFGLDANGSYKIEWRGPLGTTYGWKKGKHELFPFPQTELNVNDLLEQNPGW